MITFPLIAPSCYSDWLQWFEYLQTNDFDSNALSILKSGTCKDADVTIEYLEKQLIRTENLMLKRYIRQFAKAIDLCMAYGEFDRIYEPFRILALQFSKCLFFADLSFMSIEFRRSLSLSVIANAKDHWNKAVKQIYHACLDSNSSILDDQLYMIKKIRLFGDCEKVEL